MRVKLLTILLALSSLLWGCSHAPAASALPGVTAGGNPAPASKTDRPFAYVAQTCVTTSCPAPNGLVQVLGGAAITGGIENPTTLALDGSGNLYVGNATSSNEGNITVYSPTGGDPLRTLTGVVGVPKGLVANPAGRLFAIAQYKAGCCQFEGTGGIYGTGRTKPRQAIKGLSGFAHSPVLDKSGNVYVGNFVVFPGWVTVYGRGKFRPSRVIDKGIGLPIQLALTPDGDLVVLNGLFSGGYDVTVYAPGQSTPSLTITAGLQASTGVAVDPDGNIYVANGRDKRKRGFIGVYQSGQTTLSRSIYAGITYPSAIAFDGSGRLYVANVPNNKPDNVAVYAPGGSRPVHTYKLTEQFSALAVPQ